jgi:hypothetical protein
MEKAVDRLVEVGPLLNALTSEVMDSNASSIMTVLNGLMLAMSTVARLQLEILIELDAQRVNAQPFSKD